MISKIINSVFNFMSNPYVVVILTIITDVYMVMVDGGINDFSDVVIYIIIMPLILMLFFKCVPYIIAGGIGVVIGLVFTIYSLVIKIIRFVFDIN